MWLFSNNNDVRKKNVDKLVKISKRNKLPVARLNCWYNTNKKQSGKERRAYTSHFDSKCYKSQTDLCIGARVALRNWNILPCGGLYNGSIGTVIEIVYKNNPIGPNDKQHNHLPDYVVVDFPHLKLPPYIEPWDKLHPKVMSMMNCLQYILLITICVSHKTFHNTLTLIILARANTSKNNTLPKRMLYCHLVPFGDF